MKTASGQKLLKKFGTHLGMLRQSKGFSLRKLADEADIDFSMIHRIEKGDTNPSLLILVKLADALGIELTALLTF
jgi:transcriptional regulator with XRE-family HTH domain